MPAKKEIESIYSEEESIINVLLMILSNNNSYMSYLENIAESIANEMEVCKDE